MSTEVLLRRALNGRARARRVRGLLRHARPGAPGALRARRRAGACDRILRSERSKSMLDRILFTRVVFNSVIIQFFMEQCAHQFQGSLKVSVEQSTFYENSLSYIL